MAISNEIDLSKKDMNYYLCRAFDTMEILKLSLIIGIIYVKNWCIDLYKVNEFMKKYSNDKRCIVKEFSQEYYLIDDSITGYFTYKKTSYEYSVLKKDRKYIIDVVPIE